MSGEEWIGRERVSEDVINVRLVESFRATLDPHLAPNHAAPLGIYWCLSPDIVPAADLGPDGHPRLGVVMPDLGFGRRMWAGGTLAFHGDLAPGDTVRRTSTISDIAHREGRTGKLAIVTVKHTYAVEGETKIEEQQNIVYKEGSGSGAAPEPSVATPSATMDVTLGPTALFRYSALTFNGHRIHYDAPYATGEEGYRDLVVHGPIQATLLLNIAAATLGHTPAHMAYRGHSPLFVGTPFQVRFGETDKGFAGCVVDEAGGMTFSATFTA